MTTSGRNDLELVASLINGRAVEPADCTQTLVDPATGRAFAISHSATPEEVDEAITAASAEAFAWGRRAPRTRAEMLWRASDLLEQDAEAMARDLVREAGKPIMEARQEVAKSIATYRYYSGLVAAVDGRSFRGERLHLRHETRREPIGVVVAISAWNVPAAGPARKIAPALLAGNPVIVKPAEATPIGSLHLIRALQKAGVPPSVVQMVCGSGSDVGYHLATSEEVAGVSFTGSTTVGLSLKQALASGLTRLQLELGGKNGALVLADADLDHAADAIISAAFALAGQQCTATSRVVVQDTVHDALLSRLVNRARRLRVGDTSSPDTEMGPLINETRRHAVHGFVTRARGDGAQLDLGGAIPEGPGFFYPPTILSRVERRMEIAREEVFGPVIAVLSCGTIDEGVEILNDTRYGLSSAVHTTNLLTAERVSEAIDAGVVVVNGPTSGIDLAAPFGGFKMSGTETKEHGPESLAFFTRVKLISWDSS
jgi:aldehyde dehydrogenase (NAD+)